MFLPYTPPFYWPLFLHYFQTRSEPGVDVVADGRYARTIVVEGDGGVLCAARPA